MGWTVLYIAFGFVALWLLGEVLLQYKARLRWRLLAFVGFLGVVVGVVLSSVLVIAAGAIAFAVGQTYVTLSFRRGFSTGWALGGKPGLSKRRKKPSRPAADVREPALQVSDLEYEQVPPPPAHDPAVHEPQPLPDDTGQYGVYSDTPYAPPAAPQAAGNDFDAAPFPGYDQQHYGYDETGHQQYAAYSDPYVGTQTYDAGQSYAGYGDQQSYAPYGGDTYGGPGEVYDDTPPGGVWVPHQRSTEGQYGGELPAEQPYPPQDGHAEGHDGHDNSGYNEQQYRY